MFLVSRVCPIKWALSLQSRSFVVEFRHLVLQPDDIMLHRHIMSPFFLQLLICNVNYCFCFLSCLFCFSLYVGFKWSHAFIERQMLTYCEPEHKRKLAQDNTMTRRRIYFDHFKRHRDLERIVKRVLFLKGEAGADHRRMTFKKCWAWGMMQRNW